MSLFKRLFRKEDNSIVELSDVDFEKSKFKARIALIDDEEIQHVKRLQKDGYNIVDYPDIDNIDDFIRKKYHVVILDIQGIGKDLAGQNGGWGLLKYLKAECPHIIVLMFTGADWSITKYKPLVDLADDFLGKDLEFLDFKSKLDSAIRKAFSPKFHFEIEKKKLLKELANADTLNKIESIIFQHGRKREKALKEVKAIAPSGDVIKSIENFLSITDKISELFK